MKVLSVDDSAIIRKIIKSAAEMAGIECLEAQNGEEALEVLQQHHQDVSLILLDWNMPIKDGYNTLLEIKADDNYKHIPVMMVTTESERGNIINAIQAGAKQYLTKPFNQEDLITKMMECMGIA